MNNLIMLGICSVVVQFCTEQTKQLVSTATRKEFAPLIALFFGVGVAMSTKIGIFVTFGLTVSPPIVDYFITGVAYSGGAVTFNELLKLVSEQRPSNKI